MQTYSRIAILGYGVEGKAMTSYLLSHGFANITVCDRNEKLQTDKLERDFLSRMSVVKSTAKEAGPMSAGPKSAAGLVSWRLGENYLAGLDEFDVIFRSPGISVLRPELAKLRESGGGGDGDVSEGTGRNAGDGGTGRGASGKLTILTSLTRYFFEHCPCPIIGVTGTKGKGTTATLIYEILRASGRDVYLGGNIGEPPVLFLDRLGPSSLVVLELSSFQLMDLDRSPHVAVVLNITSEHMDYHGSFDEYVLAKRNIARHQTAEDFLILNRAHPYSGDYFSGEEFGARQIYIDTGWRDSQDEEKCCKMRSNVSETFIDENGMIVFRNSRAGGDAVREAVVGTVENCGAEFHGIAGKLEKICHVSGVGLLGEHNLENILPAIAVARGVYHVPVSIIAEVVKSFRGLPHRLEFVGEMEIECRGCGEGECEGRGRDQFQGEGRGVVRGESQGGGQKNGVMRFYNDSFSTTPETSIAGIMAFSSRFSRDSGRRDGLPLYLLAGGSEKNSVFDEWAMTVMSLPNVRRVFLMGPSGERMGAKLWGLAGGLTGEMSDGLLRGLSKNLPQEPLKIDEMQEGEGVRSERSERATSEESGFAGSERVSLGKEKGVQVANLREAFEKAFSCARDDIRHGADEVIILLSPGAASFNEFENYKKRGEAFRDFVRNLEFKKNGFKKCL